MATGYPLSTVAYSCHSAITVLNRPLTATEILAHLVRLWDARCDAKEVDDALEEMQRRILVKRTGKRFDTLNRNQKGERCYAPPRNYSDPSSPEWGWF